MKTNMDMQPRISERVLSDGSRVYDVVVGYTRFECVSQRAAWTLQRQMMDSTSAICDVRDRVFIAVW